MEDMVMIASDTPRERESMTRRRPFAWMGWGSFAAFWASLGLAIGRFFFPRTLYEPSLRFQAGKLDDYTVGEVSTRFLKDQRVWVVRESFQALSLRYSDCSRSGPHPKPRSGTEPELYRLDRAL